MKTYNDKLYNDGLNAAIIEIDKLICENIERKCGRDKASKYAKECITSWLVGAKVRINKLIK